MNDMEPNPIDAAELDRLVDGELSPERYRAMLAALDATPDGWRRCALGFLEAQALQQELSAWAAPPAKPQVTTGGPMLGNRGLRIVGAALAVAASLLVAFTAGTYWNGPRTGGATDGNDIARPESPRSIAPAPDAMLVDGSPSTQPGGPVGSVTLVIDRGDGPQRVRVPIYPYHDGLEQPLVQQPAIPAEVLRALQRAGHRVRQRRQLVPVDLDDGQRLVVPMDDIEILPVGGGRFQ